MNHNGSSLLICGLTIALLWIISQCIRQKRELNLLLEAVRGYARFAVVPRQLVFNTPQVLGVWRSVLMLGAQSKIFERSRDMFEELISLTAHLAEAADEEQRTAEALVQVLHRQLMPDVQGIAVVLRTGSTGEIAVPASIGLPKARTDVALQMCLETAFDAAQLPGNMNQESLCREGAGRWTYPGRWGYYTPKDGPCFDFTTFGFELCLLVPLFAGEGISGAIWLGFGRHASGLTPHQRERTRALCEHAAASFFAARKAYERRVQSDQERDYLLGMSHDLRAPGVRALYSVRDLLEGGMGDVQPSQRTQLLKIECAVEEQMDLLGDVLDYAKHQRGMLETNAADVSLKEAFGAVLETFRAEAEMRLLSFHCEVDLSQRIEVDVRHFRRMIANVVSNAVKYTTSGGVTVVAAIEAGFVRIDVIDTGLGVPPAERSGLFEEFRRGTKMQLCDGVGLGLALTKALAERNRGFVRYRPNPEGGSIFSVAVPSAASEEKELFRADTVLVVDDDAATCRTFVRYLQGLTSSVVVAGSVTEAKEQLRTIMPKLVITDYQLGDGTALDMLCKLAQETPVIIVTGSAGLRKNALENGVRLLTVLEKPVSREMMRATVQKVLRENARKFDSVERQIAAPNAAV